MAPAKRAPSALEDWPRLAESLAGRTPVVFLDFDGTLAEVVDHHDDAVMLEEARSAVEALAERWPVVVVSGRDREDVARRVDLPGLWYAGSHGFDIAGPEAGDEAGNGGGGRHRHEPDPDLAPRIAAVAERLRRELADVPGAEVEAKRFAVSVHYRQVSEADREHVDRVVERLVAEDPRLARSSAKKVYEVRPSFDWDKGTALHHLLARPELVPADADVVPLYIGDDVTDEDGFRALQEWAAAKGEPPDGRSARAITIHVGDGGAGRDTRAEWSLDTPAEVADLLHRLSRLPRSHQLQNPPPRD